jgi:peptidoglycan/LPS O-acetylase OafA/YrhL
MRYRADIDGLRAISVLSVLAFHLDPARTPGGFVGVDVFFVISGYLISGLAIEELEQGHFALRRFYERRIRRILPALVATVAASLALGLFLLMPGDYLETARSAAYALAASSNFFFLAHTGYFDVSADLMPLLHTWSLGIEEQFYLVWPLFLVLCFRVAPRNRRGLWIGIIAVLMAGFALNVWEIARSPKAAFYLPHTRAWEFAAGALVTMAPRLRLHARWIGEALPLAGLALIAASVMTLSSARPYPGVDAILPVAGAALVLFTSSHTTLGARLLSVKPLTFLGRISYSLYLVHWPLTVFYRHYSNGENPDGIAAACIVVCATALAWASWRWIEQPFRRVQPGNRPLLAGMGAAVALVSLAAVAVVHSNGLPDRIPKPALGIASRDAMWQWKCPQTVKLGLPSFSDDSLVESQCVVGADWSTARLRAIVWGDSHADQLLPFLDVAGREEETAIALVRPCPAILQTGVLRYWPQIPDYNRHCATIRTAVLKLLGSAEGIQLVILASAWAGLTPVLQANDGDARTPQAGLALLERGLEETLRDIDATGTRVVLFTSPPTFRMANPVSCVLANAALVRRRCDVDLGDVLRRHFVAREKPTHDALGMIARLHQNTIVHSPANFLCDDKRCVTEIDGEFIYRDGAHLRRNLAESTASKLADLMHLRDMLRPSVPSVAANRRPPIALPKAN